jgi:predicted PurR-regulated permease PerM
MFGIDLRVARTVWTIAVIIGILYGIYAIRFTLLVTVIAVFFSYFLYPLVQFTQHRVGPRVPRDAVIAVVFAVVTGIIVLGVIAFGSSIADQASGLGQELPRLLDPASIAKRLPLPSFLEPFRNRLFGVLGDVLHSGTGQALPAAQQIGSSVVHVASNLIYIVVIPILSYLLIKQAPAIQTQLLRWISRPNGNFLVSLADDINFLLSRYVRALMLLSLATLLVYSTVLSIFGAPFALLLAALAALLEIIPVIGPLIGAVSILVVVGFSGYEHVWWVLVFVASYRIFQDYILNPYLMHEGVEVPAVLVVLGLLAGNELAGVAGIFLSVPFLAIAKIVISRVRRGDSKPT